MSYREGFEPTENQNLQDRYSGIIAIPCGFIHIPLLRAQVAALLDQPGGARDVGNYASMEFPTLLRALEIALEISLGAAPRKPRSKA